MLLRENKHGFSSRKTLVHGRGFFNIVLSYLPKLRLPATQGENVPGGSFNDKNTYSNCGPGTRYEQRVREGYQGINETDRTCKLHDKFYNENYDTASRNVSDVALAHRANEIANDSMFDSRQRQDASFVSMIMKNKARFGLVSKNFKKGPMKMK